MMTPLGIVTPKMMAKVLFDDYSLGGVMVILGLILGLVVLVVFCALGS